MEDEQRICTSCLQERPITEFRRKRRGGEAREHQCRECHNEAERRREAQKRSGEIRRFLWRYNSSRSDAELAKVVAFLVRRCGGAERLAKLLWVEIETLRREKPGSPTVVNALMNLLRMSLAAARLQEETGQSHHP